MLYPDAIPWCYTLRCAIPWWDPGAVLYPEGGFEFVVFALTVPGWLSEVLEEWAPILTSGEHHLRWRRSLSTSTLRYPMTSWNTSPQSTVDRMKPPSLGLEPLTFLLESHGLTDRPYRTLAHYLPKKPWIVCGKEQLSTEIPRKPCKIFLLQKPSRDIGKKTVKSKTVKSKTVKSKTVKIKIKDFLLLYSDCT